MSRTSGKLLHVIELIRHLDPDITAQTLNVLFAVADKNEIHMGDLVNDVSMSQSSVSRNISMLSRWKTLGVPGLDLVESEEDPANRRRKIVRLTNKGKKFLETIDAMMASNQGTTH